MADSNSFFLLFFSSFFPYTLRKHEFITDVKYMYMHIYRIKFLLIALFSAGMMIYGFIVIVGPFFLFLPQRQNKRY